MLSYDSFILDFSTLILEYYVHEGRVKQKKTLREITPELAKMMITQTLPNHYEKLHEVGFIFEDTNDDANDTNDDVCDDESDYGSDEDDCDERDEGSDEEDCDEDDCDEQDEETDEQPLPTEFNEQICELAYKLYLKDEKKLVQTLFVRDSTHSDNYYGIPLDLNLIKDMPDSVKECFIEIYIATTEEYIIDGKAIGFGCGDMEDHLFHSLSTINDVYLYYKTLNAMEATTEKSIANMLGKEIVEKVEMRMLQIYYDNKEKKRIRDEQRDQEDIERNAENRRRDELRRTNLIEYYETYGIGLFEHAGLINKYTIFVQKYVNDRNIITLSYLTAYHQLTTDFHATFRTSMANPVFDEYDAQVLELQTTMNNATDALNQTFSQEIQQWNRIFDIIQRSSESFAATCAEIRENAQKLQIRLSEDKPNPLDALLIVQEQSPSSSSIDETA